MEDIMGTRQHPIVSDAAIVDYDLRLDANGQLTTDTGSPVWSCDCGRVWTGTQQAHCAGCHLHFSSDSAFDCHTVAPPPYGPRPFKTCLTVDELVDQGKLEQRRHLYGLLWGWPGAMPELVIAARR
jgi:hypothetical protein